MLTYLIYGFIFLMALLCENKYIPCLQEEAGQLRQRKKQYSFLFAMLLFLFAALRHPYTGADTAGYYGMYRKLVNGLIPLNYYWTEVVTSLRDGTFTDSVFWSFFSKLMSGVIHSPQGWLAFISALFILAVMVTVNRYSEDPILSWMYIFLVFIFSFILQGLRQSVAMAVILLSFRPLQEGKPIRFFLLVALAFLFHQSSVVFAIMYPLRRVKPNKYSLIIIIGVLIMSYFASGFVKNLVSQLASESRFENYLENRSGMYSVAGWIVLFAIFVFCFMFKEPAIRENSNTNLLLTISMLGLLTQSMVGIVAEMFRISYYYSMFNMLLIPNVLNGIKDTKNGITYRYAILCVFMAYALVTGLFQYRFYWQ